jgi:hypothetical protein
MAGESSALDGTLVPVQVDPATGRILVSAVGGAGLVTTTYDYISLASGSTTDVYTYKLGGAGGVTVATVTITYTDNTKSTILTLAKT